MKTCSKFDCEQTNPQPLENFFRRRASPDGIKAVCKFCEKKYYINKSAMYQEIRNKNKQNKTEYDKEYRQKNKEKIAKEKYAYEKYKMATDPNYRIARLLRMRMRQALKNNQKSGSAVDDLGCSVDEVRQYLESMFYNDKRTNKQMTWENQGYGHGKWQIDHIKALYTFDLENREEFLKAAHYTNLQPLWHDDHTKKTTVDINKK